MAHPAQDLPARLAAAATALATRRGWRDQYPIGDVLTAVPQWLYEELVEDARLALDAAAGVDEATTLTSGPVKLPETRIALAKFCGLNLDTQAVVLLDVARDGQVFTSTWAVSGGTKSLAIAEWARGLESHAISLVPFQTVFGFGCGGVPTPLTPEQRASLSEAGRAYADRNTEEPAP